MSEVTNSEVQDDITKNVRKIAIEDICKEIDDNFDEFVEKLKRETDKCGTIDESDLSGELTKCIHQTHVYITKLMEEKTKLNKIGRKRDDIHGEIYGKLKKGEQIRFDSKSEIEEWINRNPKWIKINTWYENHNIICQYYDNLVKSIVQKQWAIKYKMELKKVELGIT